MSSLTFTLSLVGLIFSVVAYFALRFPPKKINGVYGYRTPASMKSQERWVFAQKYSAKTMLKAGLALILISLVGLFYDPGERAGSTIALCLCICSAAAIIVTVERALKKQFGKQ